MWWQIGQIIKTQHDGNNELFLFFFHYSQPQHLKLLLIARLCAFVCTSI